MPRITGRGRALAPDNAKNNWERGALAPDHYNLAEDYNNKSFYMSGARAPPLPVNAKEASHHPLHPVLRCDHRLLLHVIRRKERRLELGIIS